MKRIFLALVAALLPIAAAPPALAHTAVRETSITDNATLSAAPANFTVTFSAATALATPPRTRAAAFTIPLPTLAPGAYTISWRTMASDGHVMPGAVHFTVAG
jgi:methionine-rich copper-binding protein CopC